METTRDMKYSVFAFTIHWMYLFLRAEFFSGAVLSVRLQ